MTLGPDAQAVAARGERARMRCVVVTGGGSGFGRATALAFAGAGNVRIGLIERDPERLEAVQAEVAALGVPVFPVVATLRSPGSARDALASAVAALGGIDVLVSNHAALLPAEDLIDTSDADWQLQMDINLTTHFVLAQEAARVMVARGTGIILFTASVNALGAGRGAGPYVVTKAGLVALTRVMAAELAPRGIRVNCVSPGPADTQRSVDLVGAELMERFRSSFPGVPLGRLASAEDVAQAFLYLASDAASYITGHNLIVDGGLTTLIYEPPAP